MSYTTHKELLDLTYGSQYVTYRSSITLSNKNGNEFDFTGSSFTLAGGDILCQGEYSQTISDISDQVLTLEDATDIVDGLAYVYRSTKTLDEWNMLETLAQSTIDLYTGQWFEQRDFTSENALSIEGSNTACLHLSVPIISISSLKINNQEDEYSTEMYKVYNSFQMPDDRQNPKIKLISSGVDIFKYSGSQAVFYEGMFNTIEGSFGYVESDGSTPELIKWCVARLIINYSEITDGTDKTIKSEKTDLHEVTYDIPKQSSSSSTSSTGDETVDRVLGKFKSPIAICGSNPLYSAIVNFYKL